MFGNLGAGEILLVLLIALIVLGPDKLPDAARKIGNVMGELRRMSNGFQEEFRAAIDDAGRPPLEPVKEDAAPTAEEHPEPKSDDTTAATPDDSAA